MFWKNFLGIMGKVMTKLSAIEIYTKHAEQYDSKDFLKQVWQTENGEDIPAEQLNFITNSIRNALKLSKDDVVLDLFCGNGHLSHFFINEIKGLHGVDGSDYLIKIANENFRIENKSSYACSDLSLLDLNGMLQNSCFSQEDFTKILIFGSIQYLSKSLLADFLTFLYKKFTKATYIYIAPVPNKRHAADFFKKRNIDVTTVNLDDNNSPIGSWLDPEEFMDTANKAGWKAQEIPFENRHYQSFYRFSILLSR